ncbi:hypothetical protein CP09DC79_1122A, partial [Chlamydia psittaci 09DC79]
MKNIL